LERAQALDIGLSRFAIHRLMASKTWELVHPNVYRLWPAGTDHERWRQRMMGAALWLGLQSGGSHRAAAVLWDLDGIESAPIEMMTMGRQRSTQSDVVIHHVRSLPQHDLAVRRGIRVTSVARTIVDLAAVVEPAALELALESALRRGLTTEARIRRQMKRSGSTSKGKGTLGTILGFRKKATDSALETLVWRALLDHGLPRPTRQYTVVAPDSKFVARVDFAYVEARLAIEADGYGSHSKPDDWRRDRRRQNALTRLGWIVYRVTWEDATRHPRAVADDVAGLLASRGASGSARSPEARPCRCENRNTRAFEQARGRGDARARPRRTASGSPPRRRA
jgi:very-short-patch-repair endonuclease